MLYNRANPEIAIDPATAEVTIDGAPLPPLPTEDLPLNRRYLLL
jgi:urease alpha subunit